MAKRDDTASGHTKLHITNQFSSWWERKYGIEVWYLAIEYGKVHTGILYLGKDGDLVLQTSHGEYRGSKYTVLYDGRAEYDDKFIPVMRWFLKH